MSLSELGDELKRRAGALQALRQQHASRLHRVEELRERAKELDEAVMILQALQVEWREGFQRAVGAVVSKGVAGVFDDTEIVVEMGVSGELPNARFRVRNADGLETDILDADGGGLVNVVCFLLRVLLLLSARPPLRRLLILDETLSNLSEDRLPAVVALLRRIVDEGGFQILLVTHREQLADAGDVVYRFAKVGDRTTIELVRRINPAEGM